MIDIRMSQEDLINTIKNSSGECVELKQVFTRLHDLIGTKLESIINDLSTTYSHEPRSQVLRRALISSDYIELLEQYLSSRNNYTHSRVVYDTHMMLFEARRSINSYNREHVRRGAGSKLF